MARNHSRFGRSSSRRSELAAALVAVASVALGAATAAPRPQAPAQGPPPDIIIGGMQAPKFAVPDCVPKRPDEASQAACRTITQVLRADLRFENLSFVQDSLMSAIPPLNPQAPKFEDWKGIGANILVVTQAGIEGGELVGDVLVHFVNNGQSMLQRHYSSKPDNPRTIAHAASDDIMTLTQYKGVAKTRIAFVSDRDTTKEKPSKELYIVDYDGFNPRRVTVNGSLNLLPVWRPDGQAIAYVSYRQGSPRLFLAKIFEGQSVANVSGEKGDNQAFSPAFSPDGKSIAFTSNRSGSTDVYVAGADGSSPRRLTTTQANEAAPCFSPTGQEIAFTSDLSLIHI